MIQRYNSKDGYYLKGYKIEIFPSNNQKEYIETCFGIARYVYNWALEIENDQYKKYKDGLIPKEEKFLSAYTLHRMYTKYRKDKPFLELFSYEAARIIINDVIYAFESFWRFNNKYPKFKTKKYSKQSLPLRSDRVYFKDNMLRIEGLPRGDKIYTNYHFENDNEKYFNTRIIKDHFGRYWFCFKKMEKMPLNYFNDNNIPLSEPIGIDLNATPTIVLSNGKVYDRPNLLKINKRISRCDRKITKDRQRLEKQQKELERTNSVIELLPSNNAMKRIIKCRKAHKKRSDIIRNFVETSTTAIVKMRPAAIVVEDLSVREMEKKHYIATKIRNSNIYSILEKLKIKSKNYGVKLIVADKYYPSSQICSVCGAKHRIGTAKIFTCLKCGNIMDRHLNAVKNLVKLAYS